MLPCLEQFSQFDELREVTLLLRRQEMKSAKKRNHVVQNRLEIVHLVIPDAVLALAHRPAFQVPLEQRQDHGIALRDVEAERHLPWQRVILPRPEAHIEASLPIHEAGQIAADLDRNTLYVQHSSLSC